MPHLYFHIYVCYLEKKERKCNNRHYSVSILHETGEAVYTLFSNSFRNDIQILKWKVKWYTYTQCNLLNIQQAFP